MARLNILRYPDPRLHTVAKPVQQVDARIRQLVDDMLETMYDAEGVGLAATQVDVHERVIVIDTSEQRDRPLVLINHFPLRQDLAVLPRIPRFSIWCGTRRTEDWHLRFRADVVIYGHLHIRATHFRDGVRFEEVSLGYPQNYDPHRGIEPYLRQILPHPTKGPARPRPLEGSVGHPQG